MKINTKKAKKVFLASFLGMFIVFTLPYIASVDALTLWNQECQGDYLIITINATINGVYRSVEIDPVSCRYGCTNLSEPARCKIPPETETFTGPVMPIEIYIVLEIIAFVMLILGIVARTDENESYLVMPMIAFILFLILSISSISIENVYNPTMMWLNLGLGLLSFVYVWYSYFKGPAQEIAENAF